MDTESKKCFCALGSNFSWIDQCSDKCAGTFLDELKANFTKASGPICGKASVAVSLTSSVGVTLVLSAAAAQFIF